MDDFKGRDGRGRGFTLWFTGLSGAGKTTIAQIGAKVGRRLPANVLRLVIVVIGVAGIVQLVR